MIPAGRIMFVPAFVVRAAQESRPRWRRHALSPSTRKYLSGIEHAGAGFDDGAVSQFKAWEKVIKP